jgi:hypothetical protein
MKYDDFKLGNIVSLKFSKKFEKIKIGIITALKKDHFIVKWIWYDKVFFLDDANHVFNELNHRYLLSETCYHKDEFVDCLEILSCGF